MKKNDLNCNCYDYYNYALEINIFNTNYQINKVSVFAFVFH